MTRVPFARKGGTCLQMKSGLKWSNMSVVNNNMCMVTNPPILQKPLHPKRVGKNIRKWEFLGTVPKLTMPQSSRPFPFLATIILTTMVTMVSLLRFGLFQKTTPTKSATIVLIMTPL